MHKNSYLKGGFWMDGNYVSSQESFQKMVALPVKKAPTKTKPLWFVNNLAAAKIQKMVRGYLIRHQKQVSLEDFEDLSIASGSTGSTKTGASKKKGILVKAETVNSSTATSSIASASVVDDEENDFVPNFKDCLIIGGKLVEINYVNKKLVRSDGGNFGANSNYAAYGVHSCDVIGITCEDWIFKKMGEKMGGGKK